MAWPHPAPTGGCWAPGSAGRPPALGSEMPQGLGAPLLQPGTLQGPESLALEDWALGAGLDGLAESKGSETHLPLCCPQCSPSLLACPPAGARAGVHTVLALHMFVWNGRAQASNLIGCQLRARLLLVPGVPNGVPLPFNLRVQTWALHSQLYLPPLAWSSAPVPFTGWLWASCFLHL